MVSAGDYIRFKPATGGGVGQDWRVFFGYPAAGAGQNPEPVSGQISVVLGK